MFGLTERSSPTFRRLLIGLVVFGVVVVLDLVLFGESEQLGRRLGLEVLEFHFPHAGLVLWR